MKSWKLSVFIIPFLCLLLSWIYAILSVKYLHEWNLKGSDHQGEITDCINQRDGWNIIQRGCDDRDPAAIATAPHPQPDFWRSVFQKVLTGRGCCRHPPTCWTCSPGLRERPARICMLRLNVVRRYRCRSQQRAGWSWAGASAPSEICTHQNPPRRRFNRIWRNILQPFLWCWQVVYSAGMVNSLFFYRRQSSTINKSAVIKQWASGNDIFAWNISQSCECTSNSRFSRLCWLLQNRWHKHFCMIRSDTKL